MYKIVVITDPDTGDGYRLAGARVIEAENPEEAGRIIGTVLDLDEIGIVAIREDFMAGLDDMLLKKIERCYHPVIVPIPSPQIGRSTKGYIERLLKRAIGYNIVMRT